MHAIKLETAFFAGCWMLEVECSVQQIIKENKIFSFETRNSNTKPKNTRYGNNYMG